MHPYQNCMAQGASPAIHLQQICQEYQRENHNQDPTTRDSISDETNCRANLTTKHQTSKYCNSVVLTILAPWLRMLSGTPFSIKNEVSKLLPFPVLHSSKKQMTYISPSLNHRVTLQNNRKKNNDPLRTHGALYQQIHLRRQKANKITANGSIRQIIMRVPYSNDPQPQLASKRTIRRPLGMEERSAKGPNKAFILY